jgi:hypothetical protein
MHRFWEANASGTPPPSGVGGLGYPTDGDLMSAIPPTNPGAYWFHMLTEELLAVIVAGGVTPNATTLTQLRDAIAALVANNTGRPGHTYTSNDWAYLDKGMGLIVQWGPCADSGASPVTVFPLTFPNACWGVLATVQVGGVVETPVVNSKTASQFTVINGNGGARTDFYIAIGR